MPLFATFLTASYREGDQRGTSSFATIRDASTATAAKDQTMARLSETKPNRQFGQPMAVSMEVPAWQLREAQQPGKALYMVGITTTTSAAPGMDMTDLKARLVVASDRETAQRQAAAEVQRQHPHDKQVGVLTVVASPDVIDKAIREWDRQRGQGQQMPRQEPAKQEPTRIRQAAQDVKQAALDVKDYAQKVIDTYRANLRHMGDDNKAKYAAIYSHAERASTQGRATLRDAARIGNATIKSYDEARSQKTDHLLARQQTAQAMAQRYDAQGRDTQRRERQLSQSMSR